MPLRRSVVAGLVIAFAAIAIPGADAHARALLIGIDNYRNVTSLVGSVNDARNMERFVREVLGFEPDDIKVLLDGDATRANILAAIEAWLIEDAEPGEPALFYYSGHGYYQVDQDNDEADGLDETIVPHDTWIDVASFSLRNMITDDEIGALLQRIQDRPVTVIIDSCHSGTMTRAVPGFTADPRYQRIPLPLSLTRSAQPLPDSTLAAHRLEESFVRSAGNMVVWSAVSAAQVAMVDVESSEPQGVFTRRFIAGVAQKRADKNKNGLVTHAELLDYLQQESAAYCERNRHQCATSLTPTLEASVEVLAADVASGRKAEVLAEVAVDVLAHDNQAGIELEILPSAKVRLGEVVRFRVSSPRDGFLVVLDINAGGDVIQIFPNQFSDDKGVANAIAAGRPLTIPDHYYGFEFAADMPVGQGLLLAIVTEDPVMLDEILSQSKDLQIIADPGAYLSALAQRLRETWRGGTDNRGQNWSLVETPYEIIP